MNSVKQNIKEATLLTFTLYVYSLFIIIMLNLTQHYNPQLLNLTTETNFLSFPATTMTEINTIMLTFFTLTCLTGWTILTLTSLTINYFRNSKKGNKNV